MLRYAVANSPFYRQRLKGLDLNNINDFESFQRKVPVVLLDDFVGEGKKEDPYFGRYCLNRVDQISIQLDYDFPIYIAMDKSDLNKYANVLKECWISFGLDKGDFVEIYDYGTSPLSYLASAGFIPYLKEGVAETLGCIPICNDGLPELAYRAVHILKYVRPKLIFIRYENLYPFISVIINESINLKDYTQAIVVSGNEEILTGEAKEHYKKQLGVPILNMLRIDIAMFLSVECPLNHGVFHSWSKFYCVEIVDEYTFKPIAFGGRGLLTITNLFAKACPTIRYVSNIPVSLDINECRCGISNIRVVCDESEKKQRVS